MTLLYIVIALNVVAWCWLAARAHTQPDAETESAVGSIR